MITSIKAELEGAVDAMAETSQKVKIGVELSSEAGTALNEIVTNSSSLQSMVQQIAAAIDLNKLSVQLEDSVGGFRV